MTLAYVVPFPALSGVTAYCLDCAAPYPAALSACPECEDTPRGRGDLQPRTARRFPSLPARVVTMRFMPRTVKALDALRARTDIERFGVSQAARRQSRNPDQLFQDLGMRFTYADYLRADPAARAACDRALAHVPAVAVSRPLPIPAGTPATFTHQPPVTPQRRAPARFTKAESRGVLHTITRHGPLSRTRLLSWHTGMGLSTLDAILADLTGDGQIKLGTCGKYHHIGGV